MNIGRWFLNLLLGVSLALIGVLFVLWFHSAHAEDKFTLPGPGNASIQFDSYQGRVMFGVFTNEDSNAFLFWRPRRASMNDLLATENWATADLGGWGISIPHPLLIALFCIPLAWWWFVYRTRHEETHRAATGLCSECGYDLRESPDRCPECGRVRDA